MYKHKCLQCGTEFYNKKQNSSFCSWECYKKSEKPKRSRNLVEVICAECGKVELVRPSEVQAKILKIRTKRRDNTIDTTES